MAHGQLKNLVRKLIPVLTPTLHKGQCGRIGVIGGCLEYTGAPYFAAISALKTGSDLVHIFCSKDAGAPIKSYSPEVIVHPVLRCSTEIDHIKEKDPIQIAGAVSKWFSALHVLVVGPGLGRDDLMLQSAAEIVRQALAANIPLIMDGDGLFLLSKHPELFDATRGKCLILTPNVVEFERLRKSENETLEEVANRLGNITIVQKGQTDKITNGKKTIDCKEDAGFRRCGGQGDVLAGSIGTFVAWSRINGHAEIEDIPVNMLACYGAATLTRRCNLLAFHKYRRSMTTSDMIHEIGPSFDELYHDADNLNSNL